MATELIAARNDFYNTDVFSKNLKLTNADAHHLQWHFLWHFATLTLWGRAEYTIICKNGLELLFKTKKCYSFIVNIEGDITCKAVL